MKTQTDKYRKVGLVANTEKPVSQTLVRQAAKLIQAAGREVLTDVATRQFAGLDAPAEPDCAALGRIADLLIVFGGDGTMLRVAREVAGRRTALLGINTGGLGFLTGAAADQLSVVLEQIWAGSSRLETRPLLQGEGTACGEPYSDVALNDFVVTRGSAPRLIELEVTVDDEVLTRYRCDGLIVSSPTGSTAYSLAAGGAVISPSAEVFAITPICPHTLSNRSVIVSLRSTVRVSVLSPRVETIVTADGQTPRRLQCGDTLSIRRSRHGVRLLHLAGSSFFKTLQRKLNWIGSHV